jgi:hypothetical protein
MLEVLAFVHLSHYVQLLLDLNYRDDLQPFAGSPSWCAIISVIRDLLLIKKLWNTPKRRGKVFASQLLPASGIDQISVADQNLVGETQSGRYGQQVDVGRIYNS